MPDQAPSWRQQARQVVEQLLDFALPPACISCRAVGSSLCENCKAQIEWVRAPFCRRCGRPGIDPDGQCSDCLPPSSPLTIARAATFYCGPIASAVQGLKYEGLFALARPLAAIMVEAWPHWPIPVNLIIPIPLHPERERERGYNQSQLLAQRLGSLRGLPVANKAMRRIRPTRPQVGLNRAERLANVQGAFAADKQQVEGRHILLLDDVYTSGSTMSAAAAALMESGARRVSGYSLARAKEQSW